MTGRSVRHSLAAVSSDAISACIRVETRFFRRLMAYCSAKEDAPSANRYTAMLGRTHQMLTNAPTPAIPKISGASSEERYRLSTTFISLFSRDSI